MTRTYYDTYLNSPEVYISDRNVASTAYRFLRKSLLARLDSNLFCSINYFAANLKSNY